MKNKKENYYLTRIKRPDSCYHTIDSWCSNCVNNGLKIDLMNKGLGRGHYISNSPMADEIIKEISDNQNKV